MRIALIAAVLLLCACQPDPDPETADGDTESDAPVACPGAEDGDTSAVIAPYVQAVGQNEAAILWETTSGSESRVDWGTTAALGQTACGDLVPTVAGGDPLLAGSVVHAVALRDLPPFSPIYYLVRTGTFSSEIQHFRTAPDTPVPFRIAAMGDSQRDDNNPDKYREVVQDGLLTHLREHGPDLAEELAFVAFAGDLVDNGWLVDEWIHEFFAPGAELMGAVPFYPVPGNHEGNSPHYFRYFQLPDNGTEGFDEHWYYLDYANLRLIGLDSNEPWSGPEQLAWLDGVLDEACADDGIDLVFAQLHHPHRSELWTHGNTDWSGEVVAALEDFSTRCDKPSIHFFGHTHAYSRGESRDHQHLMVNVSSAGGALDRWGEQVQEDYPEFAVSQDEWGFVTVDVDATGFTLQRISRGNGDQPQDNAVTDTLTVRLDNRPPDTPTGLGASGTPITLTASPYADPDGDEHQATHWQVAPDCDGLDAPTVERWRQRHNWWMGTDLQAGDDLSDEPFEELQPGEAFCWRVRYRDAGLGWSAWSQPLAVIP